MIPREMGKQLVWDVTVVDTLAIEGSPLIDSFLETLQTISDKHAPERKSSRNTIALFTIMN